MSRQVEMSGKWMIRSVLFDGTPVILDSVAETASSLSNVDKTWTLPTSHAVDYIFS